MNARLWIASAALVFATLGATPAPPPFPAFSATGTLSVNGSSGDKSGTVQTGVRVMHDKSLTRIDVSHVTVTGPNTGAMSQMLPQGTITAVFDQRKSTITVWSSTGTYYYQSKVAVSMFKPSKPRPGASPSPWANITKALRSMTEYDVFYTSIGLDGHETVNGRKASVYSFSDKMQKHGGELQRVNGSIALADDLSGIPIHFDSSIDSGKNKAVFKIDLTDISTKAPAASEFAVPKGYKKTTNFFNVLMPQAPPAKAG